MAGDTKWALQARKLKERFPIESLHPKVVDSLAGELKSETVGIACSGGADSVCLILLLWAHFPDLRNRFRVLHFDHALRGKESMEDEVFVKGLAEGLGLKFFSEQWKLKGEPSSPSESAARTARFDFFWRILKKEKGQLLIFGHHLNDIAETLLMRLSRGSGSAGLASPRPIQKGANDFIHLRPLLTLRRSEIISALEGCGISWREDSSNFENRYYRNRIRNTVIPNWEKSCPQDLLTGLSLSRQILEDENEALDRWLIDLIGKIHPDEPLDLRLLKGRPKALYRRALQRWLGFLQEQGSLSRVAMEELVEQMSNGCRGQRSFGTTSFLEYKNQVIRVVVSVDRETGWPEMRLALGGEIQCPDQAQWLSARVVSVDECLREKIFAGAFDPAETVFLALGMKPEPVFQVRRWKNGDAYQPLGSPGMAKLQDLFTNKKISVKRRHKLPIVCLASGQLIWCPYFPPAHLYRIKSSTKRAVQLTYRV